MGLCFSTSEEENPVGEEPSVPVKEQRTTVYSKPRWKSEEPYTEERIAVRGGHYCTVLKGGH